MKKYAAAIKNDGLDSVLYYNGVGHTFTAEFDKATLFETEVFAEEAMLKMLDFHNTRLANYPELKGHTKLFVLEFVGTAIQTQQG